MDAHQAQCSYVFCFVGQFCHPYSFKKCFFFLVLFLVFIVTALGLATLITIFILKPKQPIFSLQTIKLDSYKLGSYSDSTLFVSSVASLNLNAQNPNRVGIRFSHSRLHILYQGLPIGLIRVPGFYQPPHSMNISVRTRLLLPCLNVSQLLAGVVSSQDDSNNNIVQMKIYGDIKAYVRIFHITLPKVKVALDCDINIDCREFTFRNGLYNIMTLVQNHTASFPSNSQTFFKKCSLAFYL
ncbi:uncharacterized protein LOC132285234 [Cornus florida]|uniref:uncharacterized protein LOC132285234 n=1 Tax=Cornus florida TaxID=4283 RepID=UPI0028A2AE0D|nr:uncharacterized protein LOC132285234 [Cornus florida]